MATNNNRITFYVGDERTLVFAITDSDAGGAALDLTNQVLAFYVFNADKTIVITKTEGDGITFTSEAGGTGEITILTANTSTLTPGVYKWRLQITDGTSAQRQIVAYGEFELLYHATT